MQNIPFGDLGYTLFLTRHYLYQMISKSSLIIEMNHDKLGKNFPYSIKFIR